MTDTAKQPPATHNIVTIPEGTLHSGYPDERLADANCARLNQEASKLGIKTTYEVIPVT